MRNRTRELIGALAVLALLAVGLGLYEVHAKWVWCRDAMLMGREAHGLLTGPVMVDEQRMLLLKDPKSGQSVAVPVAYVLQLLANERGRQMAEAAAKKR